MNLRPLLLALSLLAVAPALQACGEDEAASSETPAPTQSPGLKASPRWLTFRCTTPGCDATQSLQIQAVGDRRLAVKRVVLGDESRTDFELTPDRRPPFVLSGGEYFQVDVRHLPTALSPRESATLVVTWGDASDETGPDRIPPQDLEIPLVRRVVGEASVRVEPEELDFGHVAPQTPATLPVVFHNEGFGNVPLAVSAVVSSEEELTAPELPQGGALPGESVSLEVSFRPRRESFLEATLLVSFADPTVPPVELPARGTSILAGRLLVEPEEGVDFGTLPRGTTATRTVQLRNVGGAPVLIDRLETAGLQPGLTVAADGELPLELPTLGTATLTLTLDGALAGPVADTLVIGHDAGDGAPLELPVTGLVAEANVVVTPTAVDLGVVPRGWTASQVLEVQNGGWGPLRVERISFAVGSSELFVFAEVPALPATLERDQRLPFTVEFRGEADATFDAVLAIETDDPDQPYLEVPITATSARCEAACVIPFATPTCAEGACAIQSCEAGRYDADGVLENGCECADPTPDPGGFCADAFYAGTLDDGASDRATFVGVVPSAEDFDFVRFFGKDSGQLTREDYDVRIDLSSSDAGVMMCVYRKDTADHVTECSLENETCGLRSYRNEGSYGAEDGADYAIKVYRDPNQPLTCTTYTLTMSNG